MTNLRTLLLISLIAANMCLHSQRLNAAQIAGKPSAVLVVPAGWESASQEWTKFRQSQGYSVFIVLCRSTAEATRKAIQQVAKENQLWQPAILLCADAVPIHQLHELDVGEPFVPTFYRRSEAVVRFGGEPEIATDYPYADLDEDGVGECAIGRIPANNSTQLQEMLNKSIAYESNSIRGPWQYEMNLVAGIGGFSMLADMAIGTFTKTLLTESLPNEYQLLMTHASNTSAYFPPPSRFREKVIEQMNRGGMFWVYVGHGNIQELDSIEHNQKLYPILTNDDIASLQGRSSSSLAMLLACYSGATDAPEPCLAEQMLRNANGPVAAVAASRVSMPYGMSVLAKEMLHEVFVERTESLGEVISKAKQRVAVMPSQVAADDPSSLDALMASVASALTPSDHDLSKERQEHLWLMNLLGDPTLKLPTSDDLAFDYEYDATTRELRIEGDAKFPGELNALLQYERGRIPRAALEFLADENRAKREQREIAEDDSLKRYEAANQIVAVEEAKAIGKGRFVAIMKVPNDLQGNFVLRCSVCNRTQAAIGTQKIKLSR